MEFLASLLTLDCSAPLACCALLEQPSPPVAAENSRLDPPIIMGTVSEHPISSRPTAPMMHR